MGFCHRTGSDIFPFLLKWPERLIEKSHRPQNKTFIRWARPGVSDGLCDINAIGDEDGKLLLRKEKFVIMFLIFTYGTKKRF